MSNCANNIVDDQSAEGYLNSQSQSLPLLATPIGISMVCRTCHYWWGWAGYGWCYSSETYLSGALQCADWIMRASGFVGFHENMSYELIDDGSDEADETDAVGLAE